MSCEHGLTTKECYVCMSPKYGEKKNNMSIEAMKQALEALKKADSVIYSFYSGTNCDELQICEPAITSLRQAIEQAQKQKPVAFASHGVVNWIADKQFQHEADLYTTPQPQQAEKQEPMVWQDTRKTWVDVPLKNVLKENK